MYGKNLYKAYLAVLLLRVMAVRLMCLDYNHTNRLFLLILKFILKQTELLG
jgi:hypothetical protein